MKICILQPSYEESLSPTKDYDWDCDPSPYLNGHSHETHFIKKSTALAQLDALLGQGFDVFINLCDGAADEDRAGIEVVQALERSGAAFTGADSHFYEPTRPQLKAACRAQGVASPAYVLSDRVVDILEEAKTLRYPLIVKHPNSYGSIGLTRESRVMTPHELEIQAGRKIAAYGAALVEEFIEGREFTALAAENPGDPLAPIVYPPIELIFPPGETFKHFDLKWVHSHDLSRRDCREPELARKLERAVSRVFTALGGCSYARFDLRLDASGEAYMLDVNPNCGVFYELDEPGCADKILIDAPGGHRAFLERILKAAVKRRGVNAGSPP